MANKNKQMNRGAVADTERPIMARPYTQNRELSWLRFDNRVLDEAFDRTVPLFERLKFVSIFESNLDEFFMIRVGGLSDLATLKHQPRDNKTGLTPAEQIDRIFRELPALSLRASNAFRDLEAQLSEVGIERLEPADLIGTDKIFVEGYFRRYALPVLSPLVIDPRHPFPNLRNGALYLVCELDDAEEDGLIGLIEVPPSMPRVVEVPSGNGSATGSAGSTTDSGENGPARQAFRYILLEDVIMTCLDGCFGTYAPRARAVIRVTRNADIDPDGEGVEEDEDYRQHMKRILKKRLRLQPVHLAVRGELPKPTLKFIRRALRLPGRAVTVTDIPLDLSYVFAVEGKLPQAIRGQLLFTPFKPQQSPAIDPARPIREQVLAGDKLLFYPYESMGTLLDLVLQASRDEDCISIRITLYRVAKRSHLCESLIAAAEHGKDVTVLMELRARFDEQNNIEWAERLEEAGCTVIYGSEGFKCHSKICLVTYRSGMSVERITLLGTGNFNEKTARLYSDFMLMTAHPGIGEDANAFFRNLALGNLTGEYRYLGVAPAGLKPLIMAGLNREIERARDGQEGRVFLKMNSLTDLEVIDKIAEASREGVRVQMIVRGICCLLPGVAGATENVTVRSIVGRFLEHARVYAFGADADTVYLSSADMMTRNTEHRVEIAFPLLDEGVRAQVRGYMDAQLRDNVKARELSAEGAWEPVARPEGEPAFNAQEWLMARARERSREADEARSRRDAAVPATSGVPAGRDLATGTAGSRNGDTGAEGTGTRVMATLIEPEPEPDRSASRAAGGDGATGGARTAGDGHGTARPHAAESDESRALETAVRGLATRPRGRVSLGLSLIGLGLRTIFHGAKRN